MTETVQWKEKNPSVLFVNPSMGRKKYKRADKLRSYLSLGTLASALRDKSFLKRFALRAGRKKFILRNERDYPSFDVKLLDLSLKPERQTADEYLKEFIGQYEIRPLMICTTATSAQLDEAKELADAAKRVSPHALRVIGGPHVSVLPTEYLNDSEYHVACIGEGTETLTEIALGVNASGDGDLSKVSGIAYKVENGEVRLNAPRKPILPLDDYPYPSDSIDLFLDYPDDMGENGKDPVYIFVGSGCPYQCIFCAQRAIHRGTIRERSADSVLGEIRKLYAKGFRKFAMVQETFLTHRARIDRFCHLIENSGLKLEWTAEARADELTFELLKRTRDAGLRFIQIGVEAGDQELLDILGKKIRLDRVKEVRNWCEALKIDTAFYMLVGLPGQDWQSLLRSAVFLRDYTPYNRITMHISVAIAIPYPGTKIAEDGSVRRMVPNEKTLDWPDRTPDVTVSEEGIFLGENFTETDDMASEEILEALIYLDDFGHFLLHAKYDTSFDQMQRVKARDYARRLFYMIERRTIRDLIVRAQPDLTPGARKNAYAEILERDGGKERLLRDVTGCHEEGFKTFTGFLATIKFLSGYHSMKCLRVPNRIRWMKLCAVIWGLAGRDFDRIGFDIDNERAGVVLDGVLEKLSEHKLTRVLERLDNGITDEIFSDDIVREGDRIKAFGLEFLFLTDSVLFLSPPPGAL